MRLLQKFAARASRRKAEKRKHTVAFEPEDYPEWDGLTDSEVEEDDA